MASGDNFTMKTEMKKIKSNRCVCIPLVVLIIEQQGKTRRNKTKQKQNMKNGKWKFFGQHENE